MCLPGFGSEPSLKVKLPLEASVKVEGPSFELHWYKDYADQRRKISRHIKTLLSDGVRPENIAILSPHSKDSSAVRDGLIEVPYPLVFPRPEDSIDKDQIGYYTIQSFKGMESEVVLLIDLDNLSNDYDLTLNYIGGSRAFLVLSAFVSEKAESGIRKKTDNTIDNFNDLFIFSPV